MPLLDSIIKFLPVIQTGASIAGNYLGGRAQGTAIQQASGINQQATNDAMSIIMGLYDEGQKSLSPYANVGPAALNNLQRLTNKGAVPAPASVRPPSSTNAMARFAPQNPVVAPGGSIKNAMATNTQGQTVNPSAQANRSSTKNATIGSGVGMGAGLLAGMAWGSFGGPIGTALGAVGGAAGGLVASQFGKNNPYKAAASRGIDQVSKEIWGTNTPGIPPEQLTQGIVADIMQRRIPVAEGKAKANALLNEWVDGMREQGTPEDVVRSSIESQKRYFQPLRDVFARLEAQPA